MGLEKQVISVPLLKGVDTKSDKKQRIPGSLILLQNARFTNPGKIIKRPGYDKLKPFILGSSDQITIGRGVTSYNDELLASDGQNLFSYSEASEAWSNKGTSFNVSFDTSSVTKNNYAQTFQDSCYHPSGLECVVWVSSDGVHSPEIRYSIIDFATKLQIVTNAVVISGSVSRPRVTYVGNYFVIFYAGTSSINFKTVNIASPTQLGGVVSVASSTGNTVYDVVTNGSRLFCVYNANGGNLSIKWMSSFLSLSSATACDAIVATHIGCTMDASNNVWVLYYDGLDVKYLIRDYEKLSVLAATTVEASIIDIKNVTLSVIGSTAFFLYDVAHSIISYDRFIRASSGDLLGNVTTPHDQILSVGLASKSFVYNDAVFVVAGYTSTYQPTYFILELTSSETNVVAKLAPLTAGGSGNVFLSAVNQISDGIFQWAYLDKTIGSASNGVISSQTNVTQTTITFIPDNIVSATLASNIHIGCGFLQAYDGAHLVEHGFHLFPEEVSLGETTGGSVATGTYQYVAVYEWIDNVGNTHRSAPSIPASITTTGANHTVVVTIPTLRVTDKIGVVCQVYRTEASGTVFYRVTSLTVPTLNQTDVNTVIFNDILADSSIIGNNQLYTTGGVVENISVPATRIFTNFKNRIIAVPFETPNIWWYSKEVVPGSPVEFSDVFTSNMDQYGGDITALGVIDDKIIFFKKNTKFYVYGNGPAADGSGDTFSYPERITGDTGAISQKSIVATPNGLMYQSPKGIYLLGRNLVDSYIGAAVESYTKDSLVTSAQLYATSNQVRFTLDSGYTVVYDYFVDQWSVDTGLNAVDTTIWNQSYVVARANGQVLVENPNIWTDNGQFIPMKLTTGWISFAQVQGFQRVWKMLLLGQYYSYHRLMVSIAENFNPFPFQQTYVDAGLNLQTTNYGDDPTYGDSNVYGGEFPLYQFRIFMQRQKCESIQITIEDTQTSDFGQGFSLSNLAFEVGAKKGANKLKPEASYG